MATTHRLTVKLNWVTRSLLVAVVALTIALVLAAWGLKLGMPEPPYGDEARWRENWLKETLRVVVRNPWAELSEDAHAPAGYAWIGWVLIGLWLLGEVLVRFVRNPIRRWLAVGRGGHDVVVGVTPVTLRLVQDWAAKKRAVVVLSPSHSAAEPARRRGAATVEGEWGVPRVLHKCGLIKAGTLTAIAGEDLDNIEVAAHAASVVGRDRAAHTAPLHVLAQVNDPFLRARIDERIDRFGRLDAVQLRLVSGHQIATRRLLRRYPLDAFQDVSAPQLQAWVVGFGQMGEEIVLSILRLAHFRNRGKPRIVIVDHRDPEHCRSSLLARWPGADAVGDLTFVSEEARESGSSRRGPEAEAVQSWMAQVRGAASAQPAPVAVYLCLKHATTNIAVSDAIAAAFQKENRIVPPIFVRGGAGAGAEAVLNVGGAEWVYGFGDADWIAEGILTIESRLDQLARQVHEKYVAEALARGQIMGARRALQPWPLLPEDLKDDNRNVADHHYVKIRDCRCHVVPIEQAHAVFRFEEDEVEELAEVEHRRWLAIRQLSGWRLGPRNEDNKIHPDMVSYGELDEATKEYDRKVVRGLPDGLREIGLGILRDFPVAVTAPRTPWAFVPAFETAIADELNRLKNDRRQHHLTLWLIPDNPMACRVAEIALDNTIATISVVLSETPQALLERQPDEPTRARIRRILHAAETILSAVDANVAAESVLLQQSKIHLALAVDARDLKQSPTMLGMDASGRVHCRPEI